MRRSYKFRLRPTRRQEAALYACLEDTRQLHSAALEEKREAWRMGRHHVIAVDPRHTTQRCAHRGHTAAGNRVTQAQFRCHACGHQAHADVNTARNILRAGLALQEA